VLKTTKYKNMIMFCPQDDNCVQQQII